MAASKFDLEADYTEISSSPENEKIESISNFLFRAAFASL